MTVDDAFLASLAALPDGYVEGCAHGRRFGVTVTRSPDGRRQWLYAEELGGGDRISFNLYLLASGPAVRPCEMPAAKVIDFVAAFRGDAFGRTRSERRERVRSGHQGTRALKARPPPDRSAVAIASTPTYVVGPYTRAAAAAPKPSSSFEESEAQPS